MTKAHIRRENTVMITDEDTEVQVSKIYTPRGERLEIDSVDGTRIRLSAIDLESLSWQSPEFFAGILGCEPEDLGGHEWNAKEEPITVTNEFAKAKIRVGESHEGIEIESPGLGYSVRLNSTELEGLCGQDHSIFSELLETPYGPHSS